MIEEPSSPPKQSPTRIIEDVLGALEPKEFEIVMVPSRLGTSTGQSMKSTR